MKDILDKLNAVMQKEPKKESKQLNETACVNLTVQVDGDDASELLGILKCAGLKEPTPSITVPPVSNYNYVADDPQTDSLEVADNVEIETESAPETGTVNDVIRNGDDMNREKVQVKKEYPGDNPMATESALLARFRQFIKENEDTLANVDRTPTGGVNLKVGAEYYNVPAKDLKGIKTLPIGRTYELGYSGHEGNAFELKRESGFFVLTPLADRQRKVKVPLTTFGLDESRKLKESTKTESNLEDDEPRIVSGVKGMKSTPFKKKFKNAKAMEKWMDSEEAGNYEVQYIEKVY